MRDPDFIRAQARARYYRNPARAKANVYAYRLREGRPCRCKMGISGKCERCKAAKCQSQWPRNAP
jgi:hypothetical protein